MQHYTCFTMIECMPNNRCSLQIHGGSILAVACVNNVVFTASADGTVKVWDTDLAQV